MKRINVLLAISALLFASLACQTVMGGGDPGAAPQNPADSTEDSQPAAPASDDDAAEENDKDYSDSESASEFPMPEDASNVVSVAGTVNYQTDLTLDEVLKFYRDYYTSQGYTEREILTTISDGVFSIVFDGDPSGQAVVIQGVDLGDGTTNVNISLQDV